MLDRKVRYASAGGLFGAMTVMRSSVPVSSSGTIPRKVVSVSRVMSSGAWIVSSRASSTRARAIPVTRPRTPAKSRPRLTEGLTEVARAALSRIIAVPPLASSCSLFDSSSRRTRARVSTSNSARDLSSSIRARRFGSRAASTFALVRDCCSADTRPVRSASRATRASRC
mgnify:CR=1 FL=1